MEIILTHNGYMRTKMNQTKDEKWKAVKEDLGKAVDKHGMHMFVSSVDEAIRFLEKIKKLYS